MRHVARVGPSILLLVTLAAGGAAQALPDGGDLVDLVASAAAAPQQTTMTTNVLQQGTLPGGLQWFFDSGLFLGFMIGSDSCYFGRTLDDAAVANSRQQIETTIANLDWLRACVPYDTTTLRDLQQRLPGMTGNQSSSTAVRIAQQIEAVIAGGTYACDNGLAANAVGNLWSAALQLGVAAGRAVSCGVCSQPLPAGTNQQIAGGLATAQQLLVGAGWDRALNGWSGFGNVDNQTGLTTYIGVIANYSWLQRVIANSAVTCGCAGGGQQPAGTDCDQACHRWCQEQGYSGGEYTGGVCLLATPDAQSCRCY